MDLFSAYLGDTFLCIGTVDEVAAYLGKTQSAVKYSVTPAGAARRARVPYAHRLIISRVESVDE